MSQFRKIVEAMLKEMAYPSNFDLWDFSTIRTFKDRVNYCKNRLKLLGNGSSRMVFQVDDEKVLKIAKNNKGIAQNEHEANWMRNTYGCFAKIFQGDTDSYLWIEMELARKAKEQDFVNYFGMSLEELGEVFGYIYDLYNHRERKNEGMDKYFKEVVFAEKNEPIYRLYLYMMDFQPDRATIADWKQIRNWGVVNRDGKEEVVIIDDGFDETIHRDFYSK